MSDSSQNYSFAGDVEVDSIKLVSLLGQVYDIKSIVAEMNIYQSLFDHYMKCSIVLKDSLNIMNDLPSSMDSSNVYVPGGISGMETVVFTYRNRGVNEEYKRHVFRIYSLTDRTRVRQGLETYILNGISIESYVGLSNKISKSYGDGNGNTISNMISSIVDEYFINDDSYRLYDNIKSGLGISVEKVYSTDETKGLHRFVIPNLSVDSTIDFLSTESYSDDGIPYFLFYEDSYGFKFKNVSNLVQSEPAAEYTYFMMNNTKNNNEKPSIMDEYKIQKYNVIRQQDILENMRNGLYRSKTLRLDLQRKNFTKQIYDYDVYQPKFKKLNEYKIHGLVNSISDPVFNVRTSRLTHNSDALILSENHLPKKEHQDIRASYMRSIFNTLLSLTVYGNTRLDVGNTIQVNIPLSNNTKNDEDNQALDSYLTGKYIITKLRHKITLVDGNEVLTTAIECTKDGSNK